MKYFRVVFLLAVLTATTRSADIKVALYPYIPDLASDKLYSYGKFIQDSFHQKYPSHTVETTMDWDPYSLEDMSEKTLGEEGCDLAEVDTLFLKKLVDEKFILPLESITLKQGTIFSEALKSTEIDGVTYGLPTLGCGNYLMAFDLAYIANYNALSGLLTPERVIGGKMNDDSGFYLPMMYFDGYVDIYGKDSLQEGINKLKVGEPDEELCKRLSWFINQCTDHSGQNKCFDKNVPNNYINDDPDDHHTNLDRDIQNGKTTLMFGFTETSTMVYPTNLQKRLSVIHPSLGQFNHPLLFVDALVINRAKFEKTTNDKKEAIRDFMTFYASLDFRRSLVNGEDMKPPHVRYLLPVIEEFYTEHQQQNLAYKEIYAYLRNAVHIPDVYDDLEYFQHLLEKDCYKFEEKSCANSYFAENLDHKK